MKSYKPSPHSGRHQWSKSPHRDAFYCTEPRCQTEVSALDFLQLREGEFASLQRVDPPKEV